MKHVLECEGATFIGAIRDPVDGDWNDPELSSRFVRFADDEIAELEQIERELP
jgi:hypothetical protein